MAKKVVRCFRCGRRKRGHAMWFAAIDSNNVATPCCPTCMAAEDRTEALGAARAGNIVVSTPNHTVEVMQGVRNSAR